MPPDTDQQGQQPDLRAGIGQAREAGYTDDEIYGHLAGSQTWGPKFGAAKQAGYSDADIRQHFGLSAPSSQESTGPVGRVAGEMWKGAKEGFGQPGTILSPEAQEKMDAIQRQGGWRGALAGLGSTAAADIGVIGGAAAGLGSAAVGAYQHGAAQLG